MKNPVTYTIADPHYYAPLDTAPRRGRTLAPTSRPDDWTATAHDVWTSWSRPGLRLADAGWKVHVSARPERLDAVLDTVAELCFEQDVAFKHLSATLFFTVMHAKHARRSQAGKFIAAYPSTADASRELMERLAEALDGEEGPYILSDRRFRDAKVVFYRYGAYRHLGRLRPDGTRQPLVPDATGRLVEDVRGVRFHLPAGISDPFLEPEPASRAGGTPPFHGFTFRKALQHSNAGGAYRAVEDATGRTVFIKEARTHNGFSPSGRSSMDRLRTEWQTLQTLHEVAPGLAPEPIAYFRAWEHEFMVTEFVEGTKFSGWIAARNPWAGRGAVPEDFAEYGRRSERILGQIERDLDRLHAAGFVFVDVSPNNVLVDAEDRARLIDFEAAGPIDGRFEVIGTPGFTPSPELAEDDPAFYDGYGLSALALGTLFPFHGNAERHPDSLALLRRELEEVGPVPVRIWERVRSTFASTTGRADPPSAPDDPIAALGRLRDEAASALAAMADPDHPLRIYPTIAEGYTTNTLCVGYGTAGVIHALRASGLDIPDAAVERLRREAVDRADELAPGLLAGLAGIAWVLADCGLPEEAGHLLDLAAKHPLTERNATYAEGGAGVAMASGALFGHTGDPRDLERAVALARGVPEGAGLTAALGADDAVGLFHGRAGIALMLRQLDALCGDDEFTRRGLRLLHAELDQAADAAGRPDRRGTPHLSAGTAGIVHAASRYLAATDDGRLAEAMPLMLRQLDTKHARSAGLCQGLSGQVLALAEYARVSGGGHWRERAVEVARGLSKFAVPHESGVRFLGDQNLRYSAELWSGSAGIVLALSQLLDPGPNPLFTLDEEGHRR